MPSFMFQPACRCFFLLVVQIKIYGSNQIPLQPSITGPQPTSNVPARSISSSPPPPNRLLPRRRQLGQPPAAAVLLQKGPCRSAIQNPQPISLENNQIQALGFSVLAPTFSQYSTRGPRPVSKYEFIYLNSKMKISSIYKIASNPLLAIKSSFQLRFDPFKCVRFVIK